MKNRLQHQKAVQTYPESISKVIGLAAKIEGISVEEFIHRAVMSKTMKTLEENKSISKFIKTLETIDPELNLSF